MLILNQLKNIHEFQCIEILVSERDNTCMSGFLWEVTKELQADE